SHLGGAPDPVGRTLKLDGVPYTIVGVMPARFSVSAWRVGNADIWVPIALTDVERAMRDNHNQAAIARLKPGVTLAGANAEMRAISQQLEREYPQANTGWGAVVLPLQDVLVGDIRPTLILLLAAGGGGARVADCVRERGQPAVRARAGPPQGACDSVGARRRTRPSLSAASRRGAGSRGRRPGFLDVSGRGAGCGGGGRCRRSCRRARQPGRCARAARRPSAAGR